MVNYQLGKIYKIVGNGLTYVGSTCEPNLARRLAGHVAGYKHYLKGNNKFITSYKVMESGDYYIELVETYPCSSKDELLVRERYWTNQLECVNKKKNQGIIAELGKKEYDQQKNKKYREENKEEFVKKMPKYSQTYRNKNRAIICLRSRQFRKDNAEIMKERDARKYQKNKEILRLKSNHRYRRKKIVQHHFFRFISDKCD